MSSRILNSISDDTDTLTDIDIDEPSMYKVILHNDHYTTMQFVVEVLRTVFHKTEEEATKIMLDVHQKGTGLCGVYIYDVANTKVNHVHALAKRSGYPLKCSLEEE